MTIINSNKWLKECDKIVLNKLGIGLHDLPDATWLDYFEDGLSPSEAVDCAYEDQWYDEIPSESWNS
tara:strand:+ start:848 stop:1048 length:201 start_codon:yes stop_codon:yes gene_type:complete